MKALAEDSCAASPWGLEREDVDDPRGVEGPQSTCHLQPHHKAQRELLKKVDAGEISVEDLRGKPRELLAAE